MIGHGLGLAAVRGGGAGLPWANLPGGNARHAWDFITNQARWNSASVGALSSTPGWSFTRASTGYAQTAAGLLVPFASGELRRTDKGVLIEGARTNICARSHDIANANWSKSGITAIADGLTDPTGGGAMDRVLASAGNTSHYGQNNITWTNVVHTISCYARYVNHRWVSITTWDGTTNRNASFDLLNGAAGAASGCTNSVQSLGGGLYRLTLTCSAAQAAAGGNITIGLNSSNAASIQTWNAAGTEEIGIWGVQIEAGGFVSSVIDTAGSSATRAADVLTVPLSGIDYPLTLFAEFERAVDTAAVGGLIETYAVGGNRHVLTLSGASGLSQQYGNSGNVDQVNNTIAGAIGVGAVTKVAGRASTNDARQAKNGTLGTQDVSCTNPAAPTAIWMGSQVSGGGPSYSYLRRASIFPRALTDAELQAVTT